MSSDATDRWISRALVAVAAVLVAGVLYCALSSCGAQPEEFAAWQKTQTATNQQIAVALAHVVEAAKTPEMQAAASEAKLVVIDAVKKSEEKTAETIGKIEECSVTWWEALIYAVGVALPLVKVMDIKRTRSRRIEMPILVAAEVERALKRRAQS